MFDWMHCIATPFNKRRMSYDNPYFLLASLFSSTFLLQRSLPLRQAFGSWQLFFLARPLITNFVTGGRLQTSRIPGNIYYFFLTVDS